MLLGYTEQCCTNALINPLIDNKLIPGNSQIRDVKQQRSRNTHAIESRKAERHHPADDDHIRQNRYLHIRGYMRREVRINGIHDRSEGDQTHGRDPQIRIASTGKRQAVEDMPDQEGEEARFESGLWDEQDVACCGEDEANAEEGGGAAAGEGGEEEASGREGFEDPDPERGGDVEGVEEESDREEGYAGS
ncbi:hypothetical protein ANO11243_083500 [Dothideomycetidae sp. 11243]|nr:hypothetical protein ANO11243_083500 [fungal sp. No.11243]